MSVFLRILRALCSFWVTVSAYISSRATRSGKRGPSIRLTIIHPFRFVQYFRLSSASLVQCCIGGGLEGPIKFDASVCLQSRSVPAVKMALQKHEIPYVETHVEERGVRITQVAFPPSA